MFSKSIVAAALVAGAIAHPASGSDACGAAVSGSAALGDAAIRSKDCASFLATTVTPAAITTTVTVTGTPSAAWKNKRAQVTYCPNKVPAYAVGPCGVEGEGGAGAVAYSSACSWLGYTADSTTTLAPTTTTKTVYVQATCSSYTSTVTVTAAGGTGTGVHYTATSTVTTTVTASGNSPSGTPGYNSTCLTKDDATSITSQFASLLTSQDCTTQTGAQVLDPLNIIGGLFDTNFQDTSDSINFLELAGNLSTASPLGTVTFASPTAFKFGQGSQNCIPEFDTLDLWYSCNVITWRWRAYPFGPNAPAKYPFVTGINVMEITSEKKILNNYSEFDSGAWLQEILAYKASLAAPSKRSMYPRSPVEHIAAHNAEVRH